MNFQSILAMACLLVSAVNLIDWRFKPSKQWIYLSSPSRVIETLFITWVAVTVVTSAISLACVNQAYLSSLVGVSGTIAIQVYSVWARHRSQKT